MALPILAVRQGGTGVATSTGSGNNVLSTSPTLVTPILGTPTSVTLTNATGLPIAGLTGLAAGIATWLATPSSANLAAAVTGETGTGALVFGTSPTFTTSLVAGSGSFAIADANGNNLILLSTNASAVNYIQIGNATTGNPATIIGNGPLSIGSGGALTLTNPTTITGGTTNAAELLLSTVAGQNAEFWMSQTTGAVLKFKAQDLQSRIASTAPILFDSDDAGTLQLSIGTAGVKIGTAIAPSANDGAALGTTALSFSDLFLATGGVINYANGNVVLTHTSGILTMGTGELRITTVGTNAASVPTLGSTSTLTAKTLTAPIIDVIKPASNSTDSFDFTQADGTTKIMTIDSTNKRVGINATTPSIFLHVIGANIAYPATTGSAQSVGHIVRLKDSSNQALDIGGNGSNGAWLQSSDITSLGSHFPILLNPQGGRVGIGIAGTVSATLHLAAGTATASTAPLKLTSGTVLTSPEAGAIEFDGSHYYGTISTTRVQLDASGATPIGLSTTTAIDAKATGTTTLYTVPAGRTAVITKAVVRVTAASSITVAATLGIGVAAGEADIFASTTMTGLLATTQVWTFASSGLAVNVAAAGVIKVGIDTAATGTSQTIAIDLIGYLI